MKYKILFLTLFFFTSCIKKIDLKPDLSFNINKQTKKEKNISIKNLVKKTFQKNDKRYLKKAINILSNKKNSEINPKLAYLYLLNNNLKRFKKILQNIPDNNFFYLNNYNKKILSPYNGKDFLLKNQIENFFYYRNFSETNRLSKKFLKNFNKSFFKSKIKKIYFYNLYLLYTNNKISLKELQKNYQYLIKKYKNNKQLILFYINSYLKTNNSLYENNKVLSLIKKYEFLFNFKDINNNLEFYLLKAKTLRYISKWKESIKIYEYILKNINKKNIKIKQLINNILKFQKTSNFLSTPNLGIIVEQKNFNKIVFIKNNFSNTFLKTNDIILSLNNIQINNLLDYEIALNSCKIETTVKIKFKRNDRIYIKEFIITD